MNEEQFRRLWSNHSDLILAALLLLVLAVELGFSISRQSQTLDEADHIHAGYRYWQCGDFGVNPEHPPLAKLIDTLPLLLDKPKDSGPPCAVYSTGTTTDFTNGDAFLYLNDAGKILAETRIFAASFTLLLGIFVFIAARKMFGKAAALLALLLLVFEPSILAHGAIVTTDIPVACWIFIAVYAFYRYMEQPGVVRMALCGAAAGLALAAKHSGIFLLPLLGILLLIDLWLSKSSPVPADADADVHLSEWKQLRTRQLTGLILIIVMAFGILWAFYHFRYAARPAGHEMQLSLDEYIQDGVQNRGAHSLLLTKVIPRLSPMLPEAYLYGMANITILSATGRPTFLLGHLYPTGRWYYFPVAFIVKSTLGFLLFLVLVLIAGKALWREKKRETLFLVIPAFFLFGLAMTSHLNMGVRHILPVYPFLIVLAAGAASLLVRKRDTWIYVIVALVSLHCVSSLKAFPNDVSYSNEAWGGPQQTYRYLNYSDVDMGGGLVQVKEYLASHKIKDCWISYFGSADLEYYGIPCKNFPSSLGFTQRGFEIVPRPIEGILLISTTYYSGVFMGPPEFNAYGPLQNVKPLANLGGHTLVFQGRFDLPLLSAESHSREAQILAGQGRLVQALQEARTGVEIAPARMEGHVSLGLVLMQAKQAAEARTEFNKAIRLAEAGDADYYRIPLYYAHKGLATLDAAR